MFLPQSHELRTPLSACFGLLGLLAETPLDQEQQDFVQTARSSCELLLDIIDSLLDYSKLEAGQLKLFYSSAPTEDAVADCLELLTPLAVGKGLELSYNSMSGPLLLPIPRDADRLSHASSPRRAARRQLGCTSRSADPVCCSLCPSFSEPAPR